MRQGGILSPFLFNIYVDELLHMLSISGFGCHIGSAFFGCIMYADDLILLSPSLCGLQCMVDICSDYANDYDLVFNAKKTVGTIVNKPKFAISDLFMNNHIIQLTDHFKYLGIHFIAGRDLSVDIIPVRRKFFIACNSIIARSHGLAEPVRVQLIKSFCLPLIVYCVGAIKLKRLAVQQLSVCWNDVFRRIFHFRRSESVRVLQVNFGTLDFKHLYDMYRWKFLQDIGNKCVYWSDLVKLLDIQYHEGLQIVERYRFNMVCTNCSVVESIAKHCESMC